MSVDLGTARWNSREKIAEWLASLAVMLEDDEQTTEPRGDLDLIGAWARLLRVDPAIVAQIDNEGTVSLAARAIDASSRPVSRSVSRIWDSQRWIDDSEILLKATSASGIAARTRFLSRILTHLDDAELVRWFENRCGRDEPFSTRSATDWLIDHASDFAPLAEEIEATIDAFRPDLESFDPDLYATTRKYRDLLGRIRGVAPVASTTVAKSWIRERIAIVSTSASSSANVDAGASLIWDSPDKRYLARLPFSGATEPHAQEVLTVLIQVNNAAEVRAEDLADRRVSLDGVESTLRKSGAFMKADFRIGAIDAAKRHEPELIIEGFDGPWILRKPSRGS